MGINVLSLFDGISCGQIALNRVGIEYDNYFASEIDKHAIKVTQTNYPKTIQLDNVTKIKATELPKIDLLIGGGPCQGFSFAGKQLNFEDPRSKLFFEFVRLLEETKPKYFLLENVKMKKCFQDIITEYMGNNPVEINSSAFSSQSRKRLYWTNITINKFNENGLECFDEYLYRLGHGYIKDEIKFFSKYPALAAQPPATKYRIVCNLKLAKEALDVGNLDLLRKGNEITRSATPEECEIFQTLPKAFTSVLNKTQRYKCIGNGWTVAVIEHIFKGLLNENL